MKEKIRQDMNAFQGLNEFTEDGAVLKDTLKKYTNGITGKKDKAAMFLLISSALDLEPSEFSEILQVLHAINERSRKKYNY
jgi:isopenicillin N synthase-like dioxygenase